MNRLRRLFVWAGTAVLLVVWLAGLPSETAAAQTCPPSCPTVPPNQGPCGALPCTTGPGNQGPCGANPCPSTTTASGPCGPTPCPTVPATSPATSPGEAPGPSPT